MSEDKERQLAVIAEICIVLGRAEKKQEEEKKVRQAISYFLAHSLAHRPEEDRLSDRVGPAEGSRRTAAAARRNKERKNDRVGCNWSADGTR